MKLKKIISGILCTAMVISTALIGVTVTAAEELPFTDVPDTWYTKAVATVYSEGIMKGKTDTTFDPTAKITRAEVVTAFSRVAITKTAGKGDKLPFDDTVSGQWYSDSVGWAAENGIVTGRGDGRFSPADNITRAELASILTKFVKYMGITLPDNPKIDKFTDADTFDSWMTDPIDAVRKNGLMQGTDGKFNPRGNATRAEIAQVIANLLPDTGRSTIVENGKSDYVIVIDENSTAAADAAERVVWQVEELCGITLDVVDDGTKAVGKEIILGKTSRGNKIDTSAMIRDEFEIKIEGDKIYVDGATADGLYGGAVSLLNTCISGDDMRFTTKSAESEKFEYPVGKIKIAGNDISKYTIYYPAGSFDPVKTAAEDISYYIEEACGVRLPVKTGTAKDYGIIIKSVASDKEFDDSFIVKSEGTNIVISGHENLGAVYGAYDFLEQCIGWHYLDVDVDYIDPKDEINVQNIDYTETPEIEYRILHGNGYRYYDGIPTAIAAKNKVGRDVIWAGGVNCHSFDYLDGNFSSQYENQPCLTDPAVFDLILKNALQWIRETIAQKGKVDIITISQNDNGVYCECKNCVAEMKKYTRDENNLVNGGTAGLMIDFVNRMSDALAANGYGDIKIHTFAYTYTLTCPLNITANDNVVVQFCPMGNCYNHPFNYSCFHNNDFGSSFEEWCKIVDDISIWSYSYNWSHSGMIYPTLSYSNVVDNYRWFAENNVNHVFENNTTDSDIEFNKLHAYLLAKTMYDPYLTEDEYYGYMKTFLKGYYGDGWELIYKAIMTIEDKYDRCVVTETTPAGNMLHLYMRSYINDVNDLMADARLLTDTKTRWECVDVAMVQYEWIIADIICFEKKIDSDEAQKACRELYHKFQKYNIPLSQYVINPIEDVDFEKFDRWPSEWRDWAFECADPDGDGIQLPDHIR